MENFKPKLIGKGTFTKVYQVSENTVKVKTTCPAKECYYLFSQRNKYAPKIFDADYSECGKRIYTMPLYQKVKAPSRQLKPRDYQLYSELRKLNCKVMDLNGLVRDIGKLNITKTQKERVIELFENCANSIDNHNVGFEISPRNIALDSKGNMILLDCIFDRKLLKLKRIRGW